MKKSIFAFFLSFALFAGSAGAATTLNDGGNINAAGDWSSGLPSPTNVGTISVTTGSNSATVFGFGAGSVVNLESGTITSVDGFNMNGGGTWNITGGKLITRYFLSNGDNPATINISGGEIELKAASTNFISTANGGEINVSGSAVLNAATNAAQTMSDPNGDIDFALNWTGQWSVGSFATDSWKTLFTTDPSMKFNGANIDGTTFDSTFTVTGGGQTLSLTNPIPEPSAFSLAALGLFGFLLRRKR